MTSSHLRGKTTQFIDGFSNITISSLRKSPRTLSWVSTAKDLTLYMYTDLEPKKRGIVGKDKGGLIVKEAEKPNR